jgi:hypothetical protein
MQFSDAWKCAEHALEMDASKKSLFTMFRVALAVDDTPAESFKIILTRLQNLGDFKPRDLIAFGHAASCAKKDDIALIILDELCKLAIEQDELDVELPPGLLIQNTAQLAYKIVTQQSSSIEATTEPAKPFAENFLVYVNMLLHIVPHSTGGMKGRETPSSVFTWFYGMRCECFIRKTCISLLIIVPSQLQHCQKY